MPSDFSIIGEVETGSAVLLLGSGFSAESVNLRNSAPPNGAGLRRHFLKELRLPLDTPDPLQVLAGEYARQNSDKLCRELYQLFRISKTGPNQDFIISEPWSRIYTTNYDDTAELCHQSKRISSASYDVSQKIPNKISKNAIIHLHGSIRSVTPENVLDSIVLSDHSYIKQYSERSPWYSQFQSDIRFCSHLFIIGYSMSDYHISALLMQSPNTAAKTFFIQSIKADERFAARTKAYGKTLFIGLDGFVSALKILPKRQPLSSVHSLKSFRALDPQKDNKALREPTPIEVFDLLTFGKFNYARCASTLPKQSYVISRDQDVKALVNSIELCRVIVVDSWLGNGKTVFINIASVELISMGYFCFVFRDISPDIDKEFELIRRLKQVVIIFEHYDSATDALPDIAKALPDAKFIVEVRTALYELRYHEINIQFPKPVKRISINNLTSENIQAFKELCQKSGLGADRINDKLMEFGFRDMLLATFESENIKNKIRRVLGPVFSNARRRKILIFSTLISNFQIYVDPSFIKITTGFDPYEEFYEVRELADEIFDMSYDKFQVRSSLFSEFALQEFFEKNEVTNGIIDAMITSVERRGERRYRALMAALMQYTNLRHLLRLVPGNMQMVFDIYERVRYDERINREPLFWLQYSIALVDAGKLDLAEQFIENAYRCASEMVGFETYQIDTQSFRILLLAETHEVSGTQVLRMQNIFEKLEKINSMINEESHRGYVLRVIEEIYPFVERRHKDMTPPEKTMLAAWLSTLDTTLSHMSIDVRVRSGSDRTREQIQRAKLFLI